MVKIIQIMLKTTSVILKLENNKVISICLDTYNDLKIKVNMYINIKDLLDKDEYYQCLYYSLNLLNRKNYSLNKLRNKLLIKFHVNIISNVLKRLEELYILNDNESIVYLINTYIDKGYGPNKIKYLLENKGFNVNNIEFNKYTYNIDKCVKKYIETHKNVEKSILQQKLFRYLYNKGYNNIDIYSYLKKGDIYD